MSFNIETLKKMKQIFVLLIILVGLISCENQEIEYDNFEFTGAYFPYQFPVRTLVLGDYIYDNSNDNNYRFIISVTMGGVYDNLKYRELEIKLDESLCNNILFSDQGDTIRTLPSNYYSLSSDSKIVIPSGELSGGIEVQLSEAFFNDPLAIKLGYVVPIRLINSTDVDTIISGQSDSQDADPRIIDQWTVPPKNFTMFAVKYINEYHGSYLHYGESQVTDSTGNVVENTTYSEAELVKNSISELVTTGRNQVSLRTFMHSEIITGEIKMLLNFNNQSCTVTAAEDSPYSISGTGNFKSQAFQWGNKDRDGIELNYSVSDGKNTYTANDVLVIRDRGVVFETYSPVTY